VTAESHSGDGASARTPRSWLTHIRSAPAFLLGGLSLVACLGALVFGILRPIGWSPFGLNVADSLLVLSAVPALAALSAWNRWGLAAVASGAASVAAWVTYATQGQLGMPVAIGWALVVWAYVGPPVTAVLAMLAGRARWFAETPGGA
jgi:hypothetical protein